MAFKQIFPLLLLALLGSGCSKTTLESKWHAPKADEVAFRFFHPESKIRYNVRNDSTHLYLTMDVADRLTMMKILQTGLRVFLGADGKKKERNELQFPIYVDKYELTESDLDPGQYALDMVGGRAHRLEQMLPTEGYLKVNGNVVSVFNGHPLADGTRVTMRLDSDRALFYEAIIPLNLLGGMNAPVALGIETGAFKLPSADAIQETDISQAQQLTAGDRAMGRGTTDPYGMSSPTGSANMGTAQRTMTRVNVMEEPVRFWVRVNLASANR